MEVSRDSRGRGIWRESINSVWATLYISTGEVVEYLDVLHAHHEWIAQQ